MLQYTRILSKRSSVFTRTQYMFQDSTGLLWWNIFIHLTASNGRVRNTGMPADTVQLQGKAKGKGNVVSVPVINTHSSTGGMAPLILNFHTRWWWVTELALRQLYPRYPLQPGCLTFTLSKYEILS